MPATFGQYVALVEAETRARESVKANLFAALLRLWRGYDRYYDGRAVEQLGTRMGAVVIRSQVQTARVAEEFTRRTIEMQGGTPPRTRLDTTRYEYPRARVAAQNPKPEARADRNVSTDVDTSRSTDAGTSRSNVTVLVDGDPVVPQADGKPRVVVTVEDVYQRPVREVRYRVSVDEPLADAVTAAENRLLTLADTDLQLASRQASLDVISATEDVIGYRRVIHPELSKSGTSCGLCIVASDRIYSRSDLMPIHNHCNCLPSPITESSDPGLRLNGDDLDRLYKEAGSTTAAKLKATRYQVTEHGELGPLLSPKGQRTAAPAAS